MMSGHDEPDGPPVRRVMTVELTIAEVATIRSLLWAAFASDGGGFTEHDWEHAVGGLHFVLERDRAIVAHASVVGRILYVGGAVAGALAVLYVLIDVFHVVTIS